MPIKAVKDVEAEGINRLAEPVAAETDLAEPLPAIPFRSVKERRRETPKNPPPATLSASDLSAPPPDEVELRSQLFTDIVLLFCAFGLPFIAAIFLTIYLMIS